MSDKIQPISMDEAYQQHVNIMKFHLRKLVMKTTTENGVPGVKVEMDKAIEGLITHFDLAVSWSTYISVNNYVEFFGTLDKLMKERPAPEIIDFLVRNMGEMLKCTSELMTASGDNVELLNAELKKQGWSDDMM